MNSQYEANRTRFEEFRAEWDAVQYGLMLTGRQKSALEDSPVYVPVMTAAREGDVARIRELLTAGRIVTDWGMQDARCRERLQIVR